MKVPARSALMTILQQKLILFLQATFFPVHPVFGCNGDRNEAISPNNIVDDLVRHRQATSIFATLSCATTI
jgi:hypothetical protein